MEEENEREEGIEKEKLLVVLIVSASERLVIESDRADTDTGLADDDVAALRAGVLLLLLLRR